MQSEVEPDAMRRSRPTQYPATNFVFAKVNRRHHEDQNIVDGDGDRGGDLVASTYPGYGNGKQRLQTPKRCKSKKNSDGRTERDRVGRVCYRDKRHVMVG